jgi:hypothetical protein
VRDDESGPHGVDFVMREEKKNQQWRYVEPGRF